MNDPILELFGECTPKHLLENKMMREKILQHLNMLKSIFDLQFHEYEGIYLSLYSLREVVESNFCDVYRLKFFRGIHQEDVHKRASFLMTWIVKIRPIQFVQNTMPQKLTIYANELFAVFVGLNFLNISPKRLCNDMPNYFANLLYLLHFHSCSPEQLASELFLLEQLFSSEKAS
jgi:hypothetical protein